MSGFEAQALVLQGKSLGLGRISCREVAGPFWDFTQMVAYSSPFSSQRFLEDVFQNSEGGVGGWRKDGGFAAGRTVG